VVVAAVEAVPVTIGESSGHTLVSIQPDFAGQAAAMDVVLRARRDPVWFFEEILGCETWSRQREVIEAVRDHARVAVRSAHGLGKTFTAARIVLWFLFCWGPRSCRAITTAPTWEGVRDLLWAEINVAVAEARVPLGMAPNVTDLRLSADWFAKGLSTDVPERFQGHHADHLLLIVDEASGVEEAIYRASKGFLTGRHTRVVLLGNPTRTVGTFYDAFELDPNKKRRKRPYHKIHLSAFDSPNLTGEQVSQRLLDALPGREWIDEMEDEYGDDSGEFEIRVRGNFADTTGHPYFNRKHLDRVRTVPPVRRGELDPETGAWVVLPEGRLWVWEAPQTGRRYVVTVDPAGLLTEKERDAFSTPDEAGDDVCIQVVDDHGDQAAEFLGRIDPDHAARIAAWLGERFARALVSVEKQGGYGDAVITELRRVGYSNLFYREAYDRKRRRKVPEIGWTTTRTTRPRMLDTARFVLRDRPGAIRSERLAHQMRKFVINKLGVPEADEGEHDDAVLSWAQAQEVRRQRFEKPPEESDEKRDGRSLEERALEHTAHDYLPEKRRRAARQERARQERAARRRSRVRVRV
jgi:hypothetical protein